MIGARPATKSISRMSPRLRRNCGVSRGALPNSAFVLACRWFERIDELACVIALLARSPLENLSPVHPANSFSNGPQGVGTIHPPRSSPSPNCLQPQTRRASSEAARSSHRAAPPSAFRLPRTGLPRRCPVEIERIRWTWIRDALQEALHAPASKPSEMNVRRAS